MPALPYSASLVLTGKNDGYFGIVGTDYFTPDNGDGVNSDKDTKLSTDRTS